jgi:hypothetical protein
MAAGLLIAAEREVATRRRTDWEAAWAAADRKKLRSWF